MLLYAFLTFQASNLPLFTYIIAQQIIIEVLFIEFSNRQDDIVLHRYTCFGYLLDISQVDDVGAMDSHEYIGQALFYPLPGCKGL